MTAVLDLQHLEVVFRGGIQAVKGISLSIAPGEILGLVGESGSGKSATAQALMGLISKEDHKVDIMAMFCEAPFDPIYARGRDVGMVFQKPHDSPKPHYASG